MKIYERHTPKGITFYLVHRLEGKLIRERLPREFDRETADVYLAKRKLEIARGHTDLPTDAGLTLTKALDSLLEQRRADCVKEHCNHLDGYKTEAEAFFGKEIAVRLLTESESNRFKAHLRAQGNLPSTINRKLTFIRAAFARAVREGKIPKNPWADVQRVSDPGRDAWRWLREEEVDTLLAVLRDGVETEVKRSGIRGNYRTRLGKSPRLLRLVVFLLNTGARRGEALALEWRDVDFSRGTITLWATKSAHGGRKAKPRHIPMNAALRGVLEAMRDENPGAAGKVFGRPANLRREFTRACTLAKIGHCRVHDCRHTFASHLVLGGVPLNTVRELLGHSTTQMVLRYAHLAPEATKKAVEVLNFGTVRGAARVVQMGEMAG